jgi:lysozyme
MRQVNQAGIDLITSVEGFSPRIYNDAGHLAIGFGHDLLPGEHFEEPLSKAQAVDLLTKDLAWREARVEAIVQVPVTDNQFAALVSLFYNIGEGNFHSSTVLRKLNGGMFVEAADAFRLWKYSRNEKGEEVVNPDLVARREREIALFNTP